MPELASADRLLMQLAVITGVALIAAEFLRSLHDVRRVLRVLCWAGAFCGVVAALQFWVSLDLAPYLRDLPGFSLNTNDMGIGSRGGLNRVAGTSIYPIELGVVAGMLLPLAIYLAVYDTERSTRRRWAPVGLIALAIPASVSRSAVISVAAARRGAGGPDAGPSAAGGALCSAIQPGRRLHDGPGGDSHATSTSSAAGTTDPSVAARVSDYPLVEQYVHHAPLFGRGGWTYFPDNAIDILDNQFLKTAIELGLVGVAALTAFFLVPTISALIARRQSSDPELRFLCAALAGAALAATACSFTFDSLSYPMFTGLYALVIGLIGAAWQLAAAAAPARVPSGTESAAEWTEHCYRLEADLGPAASSCGRCGATGFVTLPIIGLTLIAAFYVVAVKAPGYKVSSSYVLINPPPPPTADQIAQQTGAGAHQSRTTLTPASRTSR